MAATTEAKEISYALSRGYRDSARLHLQHWMWQCSLGYLLHPSIPISNHNPNLRVLDIGAGNGCWILELARHCPSSWTLEGTDISAEQFPAKEYLPANVSLRLLDAFQEIPEELHGVFDVVHIRAFALVVKGGDPGVLLDNLIRMLKPGGYLQWDEKDTASFNARAPNPLVSKDCTERLLEHWQRHCVQNGLLFRWISDLPQIFIAHGLHLLHSHRQIISNDLRKASTDNWLMGLEEFGMVATTRIVDGPLGTREEFLAKYADMVGETTRGVSIAMDMVVVVGRKAA